MTKDDLIGIFRTCENNCKVVYASSILFSAEETFPQFVKMYETLEIPKIYKDLYSILYDRDFLCHAFGQLYESTHRAALKELFEITKFYCGTTNQSELLKRQPWFHFWRVIRNCFSHDFQFQFKKHDMKFLPITWRDVILDVNLEGKHLTHGMMSSEKIWELLNEVVTFIKTDLV